MRAQGERAIPVINPNQVQQACPCALGIMATLRNMFFVCFIFCVCCHAFSPQRGGGSLYLQSSRLRRRCVMGTNLGTESPSIDNVEWTIPLSGKLKREIVLLRRENVDLRENEQATTPATNGLLREYALMAKKGENPIATIRYYLNLLSVFFKSLPLPTCPSMMSKAPPNVICRFSSFMPSQTHPRWGDDHT